jgi:hypothetical protein
MEKSALRCVVFKYRAKKVRGTDIAGKRTGGDRVSRFRKPAHKVPAIIPGGLAAFLLWPKISDQNTSLTVYDLSY